MGGPEAQRPQGLVNLVHERMRELTAAERKVARVFLASYPIAGLETVAQLAQPCGRQRAHGHALRRQARL